MHSHSHTIRQLLVVAVGVLSASLAAGAAANDVPSALTPFVNGDTFAAARVDVVALPSLGTASDLIKALPSLSSGPDSQSWALAARIIEGTIKRFREAGGQDFYVVAGLADVRVGGGPVVIATCQSGKSADVERLLQDLKREFVAMFGLAGGAANTPAGELRNSVADQFQFVRKGDRVLIGTKATVASYTAFKSSPRPDLIDPLGKLVSEGAVASAVFCPGSDYRRVVRELWPQLRGTFAPLTRELAAGWQHIELAVNAAPNLQPRLVLQARDHAAAEVYAKLWQGLPQAVTEYGGNDQSKAMAQGFAQLFVGALPAKVDGSRVEIVIPTSSTELGKLAGVLTQATNSSLEGNRRKERMNQFKQLTIALINYHDVHKHFPTAAISDKDGKPLLSWRVAILPYLEQSELYKQFHLDEPWDSLHNIALVQRMPEIYADPSSRNTGKTTYQAPTGPSTSFPGNVGTSFREMKDGSSKTVLVVDVDPDRAVEWTKPSDWEVDLASPHKGLATNGRKFVTLGFADGHVQIIDPQQTTDDWLRAVLTPAGGETIDYP